MKAGAFLKAKVAELGLSQPKLAAKCGVSQSTINRILLYDQSLDLGTYTKIMQAFGEDAPHHVSLALLEDMLRRIIKEELKAAMHQDTVDDADYLASLPPEERKAKLKEMKK